jgi:two-component system sensor histidine kinase BaeS
LLTAAVAAVRDGAGDRGLDIGLGPCADLPAVQADPQWLRYALDALLSNAVRFTPDGGRIHVRATVEHGWACIAVADQGIGIAPEHLAEVFEPFSAAGGDPMLHGSGRFAFGARGLGLGLAMVKGIAEAHGGTVEAASVRGRGSCFSLRLPCAAAGCG